MNKVYADVTEDYSVDGPNFQWVVLASEVEEMIEVERLRADVAVTREAVAMKGKVLAKEEADEHLSVVVAQRSKIDELRHDITSYLETTSKVCDMLGINIESAKGAEGKPSDVLFAHVQSLQELGVTNILLDIVPGADGMGEEIYARSVDDVTAVMTKQQDLIEELREELEALKARQPVAKIVQHYGFTEGVIQFLTHNSLQLPIGTFLYTEDPVNT